MDKHVYVKEEDKKYWDKLEEIGEQKDRSVSYLANKAVKEYVKKEGA